MKFMKNGTKWTILIMLFLLIHPVPALAAGSVSVAETYTGESEISLYLKGTDGNFSDIQVQAGTSVCDSVTKSVLAESGQPVKTLIMLDNSLSITKSDRKQITKILKDLVAERMENEQMAVAVFHEEVEYLAEYTSDDAALLDAVNEISYHSSHTYLTDVLYDLLNGDFSAGQGDVFRRMIVISDGMDNKSIGYTKEELFGLLNENPVPIYTIGAQTAKKDNQKQLKNMFAISRMTNAAGFLLGGDEKLSSFYEEIQADRDIIKLVIRPSDELMDGSRKTVKITLASGETVTTEAAMPQQVQAEQDTEASDLESPAEDTTAGDEAADGEGVSAAEKENGDAGAGSKMAVVFVLAGLAAFAAAAIAFFTARRKKKQNDAPDARQEFINPDRDLPDEEEKTEMLDETDTCEEDGDTVLMWNEKGSYTVILTDADRPVKSFQASLSGPLVIGRKQGCGIVIDYDRSVSGRHCEITVRGSRFYISDLQSLNGTYVDAQEVVSETEIVSGSILKFGKLTFIFEVR